MGGPSAHGQRNKGHKAGRNAGKSARDKHKLKKEGAGGPRASIKSASNTNKLERAQASKQHRDAKRNELLEARRRHSAPVVVALLPLSDDVDAAPLWAGLVAAAGTAPAAAAAAAADGSLCTVLAQGRRRVRLTLLPAPKDRNDPLAIVDLAKAAEVLLLLLPGQEGAVAVDAAGSSCLTVLRAMGLPSTIAVVLNQQQHGVHAAAADAMGIDGEEEAAAGGAAAAKGSSAELKRRSAAKKRAEKALQQHLSGDTKLVSGDNTQDMQQLLRTLADSMPQLPVWRRQRPYIMVQQASFEANEQQQQQQQQQIGQQQQQQQQQLGQLRLTGYVRAQGLSANQLITVPGAGDFRILRIEGPPDPAAAVMQQRQQQQRKGGAAGAMDMDMQDAAGAAAGPVLALPDPERQEPLVRENEPDPLDGEQTWPTEEELAAAAAAGGAKLRKRRLPAGTSEYQAAWILDDDEGSGGSGEAEESDDDDDDDAAMAEDAAGGSAPSAVPLSEDFASEDYGAADDGDDASMMGDDEEAEEAAAHRMREELKTKRLAEAEDAEYPDEIDTPQDMPARQRFAKYRGLKSFRSSPWDAREGLPADYGRVFAFENFKRTAKRAHEAVARSTDGSDPCSVLPGSWVTLVLADVPAAAAAAVLERTAAAAAAACSAGDSSMSLDVTSVTGAVPLTVYGLLQHEAKLSVVNFSMKKAASYAETIRSKEELLLVCGVRSFMGQPVLSDDAQGADKNKMERFLHPGKTAVGSVYAPISFPPLPLLAFKVVPGQHPQLAATGALRSVDPDRLIVKKIVLSGYPVRVHKTRAVVRLMFFNPDDIRWFKPVELWTKSGRRGRITEPLGTHGAYKARFDGPVQQRDSVCMSLYKRVFPKWPAVQQQQQQGLPGSEAAAGQQAGLGMACFA